MKIKQIGNYQGDLISATLENRGIVDTELYYNPTNEHDSDPQLLINVEEGTELVLSHLSEPIGIVVDADMDGYSSASLTYQYLKVLNPNANIQYFVHEGKAHGLTKKILPQIYKSGISLLIVPDAGSNDVKEIEELETNGITVLIIDHHEVDKTTDKGLIINNQLCEHTNKNLVGVGMVYKFFQFFDGQGTHQIDRFLDLVAAGQIGDSSDISDPEIRNLVVRGLDNIENKFFKTVLGELSLGQKFSAKDLSFNLIPLVNAVVRVGTLEECKLIFEAMNDIGSDRIFHVIKKKKNQVTKKFDQIPTDQNLYEYAADIAAKCKARQAALVKKLTAVLEDTVDNNYGIVIAQVPDSIDVQGVSGLVANKLMAKYDKPCILISKKDEKWQGSGRGHERIMDDFRAWCEGTGQVEFAQGHANAFGISIPLDNIEAFKEASKTVERVEAVYEVDILTNKLDPTHAEIVDQNRRLFGGAVSEPLVGVMGLTVPKKFISMKGSMLNIYSWGVGIVQFGASPEFFADAINYPEDSVPFNIVGTYGMNDWGGRKSPQFIVKDIEIAVPDNEEITVENIIF